MIHPFIEDISFGLEKKPVRRRVNSVLNVVAISKKKRHHVCKIFFIKIFENDEKERGLRWSMWGYPSKNGIKWVNFYAKLKIVFWL